MEEGFSAAGLPLGPNVMVMPGCRVVGTARLADGATLLYDSDAGDDNQPPPENPTV